MTEQGSACPEFKTYYLTGDLHIGGDGELDECEFEAELCAFLQQLETEADGAELVITGDLFGLWESTVFQGPDKLHGIIVSHIDLFLQFQRTGRHVRITAIPGNHDHELALNPEFGQILRSYNIHLEPCDHIVRSLAGRKIWIEHGNQHDSFNRFDLFDNPACKPIGYYVTSGIISGAGTRVRGRNDKWIKDIGCVYPTENVPRWLLSNYFYREMSSYLRALALPFLLLFATSTALMLGVLLELLGVVHSGMFLSSFSKTLGPAGYLLDAVFLLNGLAVLSVILVSLPLILIRRDVGNVLLRYGVDLSGALSQAKDAEYARAAETVFEENPDVALFAFGHTHHASVQVSGGRAVINTGTWVKRLICVPSRFYLLPDVYCSSYRLGFFKVSTEEDKIRIEYHRIPKESHDRLSFLQRLSIWGQRRDDSSPIPDVTFLERAPEE